MGVFTLPENFKIVTAIYPITTNAATTGDCINLKNVSGKVWVVVNLNQTVAQATTIGIDEATSTTGAGATATTQSLTWWKNVDISDSDTLVAQTAAATLSAANTTNNQMIVCQIDPALLSTDTDAIRVTATASSQATNHISANYYLETQYKKATPPAAISS